MDNFKKNKLSSWHKRTWLEKILIIIIIFITITVLFLAVRLILKLQGDSLKNTCMTEKCIRTSASILNNMDLKIDPCDDFYKFTCGKFIQNTDIPDDATVVTTATSVSNQLMMRLREILEEKTYKTDPKHLKILKAVYSTCMNTTRIAEEGLAPIKTILKDLGGWPVVEGNNWNERDFDWKKMLYRMRQIGLRQNVFFQMYVGTDLKNSSKRILTISQGCFPQEQLKNESYVKHYHELLTDVAVIYGADRNRAKHEMGEVMKFLKEMANITIPYKDRKNSSLEYNLIKIRDLEREYPSIPWLQYINSYLSPYERMYEHESVNVGLTKFMRKLEVLMKKTDKRVLANYMSYLAQVSVAIALPEILTKRTDEFVNKVWGRATGQPRWKTCVGQTYSLNIGLSFSNKAECLVEQYKNFTVPELGVNLNGVNNLGENIADNGGIMIAYRGYEKWMERNGEEPKLPGLPYNARQMFWISAAYPVCAKYKKETLKNLIDSGYHAPWYYRVTVPFMNSERFAKDFSCPVGSRMNPEHKCRVW